MASQYSNDRATFRKNNPGVNTTQRSWDNYVDPQTGVAGQTTQRSWDNYVGEKPIKRYKGTDFYNSSERWAPGGSGLGSAMDELMNEEEEEENPKKKRSRKGQGLSDYDTMRIRNTPQLTGEDGLIA
jgi:hypothetical protein